MASAPVNSANPTTNGQVGSFMVAAGAIIEHSETEKILLLKRADVDYKSGVWETGYGRLEQGEDPETGLRREIKEETGLTVEPKQILTTWFFNRGAESRPENEVVGITYWVVSQSQDVTLSYEHNEYSWVTPKEALEILTEEGVKRDVQAYINAKEQERAIATASEKHQRALADYHNLVRRTEKERSNQAKMASKKLVEDLLEPLEHLSMAAEELDDQGLNMVVKRLWEVLSRHGLTEIEAIGQPFDLETMEVVERQDDGETVVAVRRRGYKLHDTVIQHAKVVLGTDN